MNVEREQPRAVAHQRPLCERPKRVAPPEPGTDQAVLISDGTTAGSGGFGRHRLSFGGCAYCAGFRSIQPHETAQFSAADRITWTRRKAAGLIGVHTCG